MRARGLPELRVEACSNPSKERGITYIPYPSLLQKTSSPLKPEMSIVALFCFGKKWKEEVVSEWIKG
jgi:hypothetical protein